MSIAGMMRGRHLLDFRCEACGPVEHATAMQLDATAMQLGEVLVLVCWPCLCRIVMNDHDSESDTCAICWPTGCPRCPGVLLHNKADHRAHVLARHPDS